MTLGAMAPPISLRSVTIKGEEESKLPFSLFYFFGYIFILFFFCVFLRK